MTQEMHLICENIQEITLLAWPVLYGDDNRYDLDSRMLLSDLQDWGEEFERWWQGHNQDWIDAADYQEEITKFTDQKIGEYLRMLT